VSDVFDLSFCDVCSCSVLNHGGKSRSFLHPLEDQNLMLANKLEMAASRNDTRISMLSTFVSCDYPRRYLCEFKEDVINDKVNREVLFLTQLLILIFTKTHLLMMNRLHLKDIACDFDCFINVPCLLLNKGNFATFQYVSELRP
jgi:hypothetical protein